jgi:hypothetical protein
MKSSLWTTAPATAAARLAMHPRTPDILVLFGRAQDIQRMIREAVK